MAGQAPEPDLDLDLIEAAFADGFRQASDPSRRCGVFPRASRHRVHRRKRQAFFVAASPDRLTRGPIDYHRVRALCIRKNADCGK